MRLSLVAALLVAASQSFACPNLSGNYKLCTSTDGSTVSDMVVAQSVRNGVTTFTITSTDDESGERETLSYIADGKTRVVKETDPDSGMVFLTKTTVSCTSGILKANVNISTDGDVFANFDMTSSKTGQRLISKTKGTIFGEEQEDTQTCE